MLDSSMAIAIIPSPDPPALRPFYEQTLGLAPARVIADAVVMLEAGHGSRLAISRSSGRASGTHTQLVFIVDDLRRTMAHLRERGVTFEEYESPATVDGVAEMPAGLAAWFRDPEGNILGLLQLVEHR
jgi:predicted enzyme related to lactoylglutathione lyase